MEDNGVQSMFDGITFVNVKDKHIDAQKQSPNLAVVKCRDVMIQIYGIPKSFQMILFLLF